MVKKESTEKKLTPQAKKRLFLEKYEELGAVWPACKAIGIKSRTTPYKWRSDKQFAAAFDEVQARVEDILASDLILVARGRQSRTGAQVTALIFTLKALNPRKYAEKYQVTGENGNPLEVDHDPKGKLLSAITSIAAKSGESKDNSEPQPGGS